MSLVPDKDVEAALAILSDERGGAYRAAHEFADSMTRTVLAELMGQAEENSEAARERWARAQPAFKEHLVKVGRFAKQDYQFRQRYAAAEAKIEIWRTESANVRASERVR